MSEYPWRDKETLRELYHDEGLSLRGVADELGTSSPVILKWMRKHGLDTRSKSEAAGTLHAPFYTDSGGYEAWVVRDGGVSKPIRHHRLLAIAAGYDANDVFSGDYDVHHLNDIPWDNRPENVALLDSDEHRDINRAKRWNGGNSTAYLESGYSAPDAEVSD